MAKCHFSGIIIVNAVSFCLKRYCYSPRKQIYRFKKFPRAKLVEWRKRWIDKFVENELIARGENGGSWRGHVSRPAEKVTRPEGKRE